MHFPKNLLISGLLLPLFAFAPATLAQNAADDALGSIKNRLQQEDIEVIDYSMTQSQWGALPSDWVKLLIEEEYESLADLAEGYQEEFEGEEGLNRLRYELGILEAQKTQADTQQERDELEIQIQDERDEIEELEEDVKFALARLSPVKEFGDASAPMELNPVQNPATGGLDTGAGSPLPPISAATKLHPDEIVNAIFREVNFYFSQVKWGNLPYPIAEALREESLLWEDDQRKGIRALENNFSDMEELAEQLQGLEYRDENDIFRPLIQEQIDQVIAEVVASRYEGERQLYQTIVTVVTFIRNIVGVLAILWIVISGIRLATAQGDETVITEQKRAILYAVIGLMAILLIERAVAVLYGTPGELRGVLAPSEAFNSEIYGLVNFIRALVGIIAILFIIRAGFASLLAQDEDKVTQNRKSIIYVLIGMVIIAINRVIIENIFIGPSNQNDQIYSSNIANVINVAGNVLKFALGFVGLIALAALVYGGANLLLHYGNDDMAEKSKKIIKSAIVGILIIISAYTIVATLVVFR